MNKVAVSGTYSTGKTLTSLALSLVSGIPRTHAATMRQILPNAFPGKRLEECQDLELLQLGIIRYSQRFAHERSLPDGFISDGSSLHEWVYGKVRVHMGIHPQSDSEYSEGLTGREAFFEQVMDALGSVVKRHALRSYDLFLHLPIEFPLVEDGHRPVSERFREISDRLLRDTIEQLNLPIQVISGSVSERLEQALSILGRRPVMPVTTAVEQATRELASFNTADELSSQAALPY
ncbi:MAG: AAA family ATPase [Propionibacteriaceae bacterium]|nr:AAA family ATPase [Propionibacteriaceae bacterium]